MDTRNIKVGQELFGAIAHYKRDYFDSWKVVKFKVIKVNNKSFLISYNAHSKKYPTKIIKQEERDTDVIWGSELEVWESLQYNINIKKNKDFQDRYLLKKIVRKINKLRNQT